MKFSTFFHPHFIIKYYLLRDLTSLSQTKRFSGKALDIGCGEKPYQTLFPHLTSYLGIDFKQYSKNTILHSAPPDFFFSESYKENFVLPFHNGTFDHIFSFQVAEHHPSPEKHIDEMVRITKKNGTILLSVPFIWALHEEPHDYFRYTEHALRTLFTDRKCRVLSIKKQGSFPSTITMLGMDYNLELIRKRNVYSVIGLVLAPLLLLISYLCLALDGIFPSQTVFLNYVILVKKL